MRGSRSLPDGTSRRARRELRRGALDAGARARRRPGGLPGGVRAGVATRRAHAALHPRDHGLPPRSGGQLALDMRRAAAGRTRRGLRGRALRGHRGAGRHRDPAVPGRARVPPAAAAGPRVRVLHADADGLGGPLPEPARAAGTTRWCSRSWRRSHEGRPALLARDAATASWCATWPAPQLLRAFADAYPHAFFVEIGSNDGEQHDHLRPFILSRPWRGIMVEPVPYVFERLRRNYESQGRIELENVAVAERGRPAALLLPGGDPRRRSARRCRTGTTGSARSRATPWWATPRTSRTSRAGSSSSEVTALTFESLLPAPRRRAASTCW